MEAGRNGWAMYHEVSPLCQRLLVADPRELKHRMAGRAAKNGDAQLLQTMPGVGVFIALTVVAEMGDISRFRHGKALVGYSGLAPQVYQSGERTHYGPPPRSGNRWLRYVMVLAAQHVARSRQETFLRRPYFRVHFGHGPNPAKMATTRKMLTVAWHVLVRQEPFAEPNQTHC